VANDDNGIVSISNSNLALGGIGSGTGGGVGLEGCIGAVGEVGGFFLGDVGIGAIVREGKSMNRDYLWRKPLTGSRFCSKKSRLNLWMPFEEKS
jgi:hypothetical protein